MSTTTTSNPTEPTDELPSGDDLQETIEGIMRDLLWARLHGNGSPYIDNVPQAAQGVISYLTRELRPVIVDELEEYGIIEDIMEEMRGVIVKGTPYNKPVQLVHGDVGLAKSALRAIKRDYRIVRKNERG